MPYFILFQWRQIQWVLEFLGTELDLGVLDGLWIQIVNFEQLASRRDFYEILS